MSCHFSFYPRPMKTGFYCMYCIVIPYNTIKRPNAPNTATGYDVARGTCVYTSYFIMIMKNDMCYVLPLLIMIHPTTADYNYSRDAHTHVPCAMSNCAMSNWHVP